MDVLKELDSMTLDPNQYKIIQKAYTEIEKLRREVKLLKSKLKNKRHDGQSKRGGIA